MTRGDSFGAAAAVAIEGRTYRMFRVDALAGAGLGDVATLPRSLRLVLENLLRNEDGVGVTRAHVAAVAGWDEAAAPAHDVPLRFARVLMQDSAGVPALCDLAAMRDAFARLGLDPEAIVPACPVDLVIDHSLQVDAHGAGAMARNVAREYERNHERYRFLRWTQQAFRGIRVFPPGSGILHQLNLEHLARVVCAAPAADGAVELFPDSVVGTDSHTTMINALGVLGWGIGGIEAEAVMLGEPVGMLVPRVVGVELRGALPAGATATDLVLTLTELLRRRGVTDTFVEFHGDGLAALSLPERATLANMAPEYGATMGFFPIDAETLAYLRLTGRAEADVALVERYARANRLWHEPHAPLRFSERVVVELGDVEPSVAGPSRPQDRVPLAGAQRAWRRAVTAMVGDAAAARVRGPRFELGHGSIVIAAITSCTNTSNPAVMLAAGLVARNARARGLAVPPWVKPSLAPGSQVVTDYLRAAGLMDDLAALGFDLVGYGCTTCVGNAGPLDPDVAAAVAEGGLVVTAVLSGNRNFEGRVHPLVRANYLASPPLVVAYALAGTVDVDLAAGPLGVGADGAPVYLRDLWPSPADVAAAERAAVRREHFVARYADITAGDAAWRALATPAGPRFAWDPASTYLREPPFFTGVADAPAPLEDLRGARALAVLGDSVTTDHISPAGHIPPGSPAGAHLAAMGVAAADFNQYNTRRGHHEVLVRGTFANIRLRNRMVPGVEGGVTRHVPSGDRMTIHAAAERYAAEGVPLVVLAGRDYGMGSSRDWAAKGTRLLGVRAVIASSFERIHRANLVGMGVLPLQLEPGEDPASLGLTGDETFDVAGLAGGLAPAQRLEVRAGGRAFAVTLRADTPQEVAYLAHGGILPYVLRDRIARSRTNAGTSAFSRKKK